jgi:hypothetical protein
MKKKKTNKPQPDDMLPEYDLEGKKGVRGKYANSLQEGYSVRVLKEDGTVEVRQFVPKENAVVLDPDVKAYFPDSESVNHALRSLINIIPEERLNQVAENQEKYGGK